MSRPIPGVQALQYRKGGSTFQRCSRCHREFQVSALVGLNASDWRVRTGTTATGTILAHTVMVGQDLIGVICNGCVDPMEIHIQADFPDRHAYPFVDDRGRLIPTPRCELGHALVYSDDGRGMVCNQCDVLPREPFREGDQG